MSTKKQDFGSSINTGLLILKDNILSNPIVYSCIKTIASSVSSIPVSVTLSDESTHDDETRFDILNLFKRPNARHNFNTILYRIAEDLLIYGSSYLFREINMRDGHGYIKRFFHVDNKNIKEKHERSILTGYNYFTGQKWVNENFDKLGRCNISVLGYLSKSYPYKASPCNFVRDYVEICRLIDEYNKIAIQNQSRFNGILEIHSANESLVERIRDYVRNNDPGTPLCLANSHAVWRNTESNNDGYDISSQMHVMKSIARVFGIPPILLGLQESNGQYQYESARRHFWEDRILPLVTHIFNILEDWFSGYHPGIRISAEWNAVPAFSSAWFEYAERINSLDFLTREEKRELCNSLFTGKVRNFKME